MYNNFAPDVCEIVPKVQALLHAKASASSCDYDGRSALHLAAAEGYNSVVELLLSHKADPNVEDRWKNFPIDDAEQGNFISIVKLLQAHGGAFKKPSKISATSVSLIAAAAAGDVVQVKQLLEDNVDPNTTDYDHRTALHLAAAEEHYPVAELLLCWNASILAKDRWGNTPLSEASQIGNGCMAKILQKALSEDVSDDGCPVLVGPA